MDWGTEEPWHSCFIITLPLTPSPRQKTLPSSRMWEHAKMVAGTSWIIWNSSTEWFSFGLTNFEISRQISIVEIGEKFAKEFEFRRNSDQAYLNKMELLCTAHLSAQPPLHPGCLSVSLSFSRSLSLSVCLSLSLSLSLCAPSVFQVILPSKCVFWRFWSKSDTTIFF